MIKPKSVVLKIIVLCVSVIFSLTVAELILRVYSPFGFQLKGNKIILETNKVIKRKNPYGEKIDNYLIEKKNDIGFRGEDPPPNFRTYLTVVAIGGSTTESIVLNEGDTWTDRLSYRLDQNFNKLWVNNAGLDGHSTFGHLILMRDYIIKIQPKIALFLIGVNELYADKIRKEDYDYYEATAKRDLREALQNFFQETELYLLVINLKRSEDARKAGLSHQQVDFLALRAIGDFNLYTENEVNYNVLGTSVESDSNIDNLLREHREKFLTPYASRLRDLIKIARDNGIDPVFITQPAVYGYAIDDMTGVNLAEIIIEGANGETGEGLTGRAKWELLELYNNVTREVAQREDILLVDLARKMPKSTRYYYDYIHFTREGSDKVAEIIYSDLCPYLFVKYARFATTPCF